MSRVLLALIALAALLAGVAWFVASSEPRRPPMAPVASSTTAVGDTGAAVEPVAAAPGSGSEAPAVEPPAARERAAARTATEQELARAQWVEGRVVSPPGTPPEEELFLTADGRDFADGSDQRVRVERGGRFRIAFSEKTRRGTLRLEGRYLYLAEPARWKRGDRQPIVLEPLLGGRIVARILPPTGMAPAELGGTVALTRRERQDGGFSFDEQLAEREPDTAGEVAFQALEAEREHTVEYDGPRCVGDRATVTVAAGRTAHIELPLRPGLIVAGRVLGEDNEPPEGIDVAGIARLEGQSGVQDFRFAESAADGTYRLGALRPATVKVTVSTEGFEPFETTLEPPVTGDTLDLDIVLRRGRSIAGTVRWPDGSPAKASLCLVPLPDGKPGSDHETVDVSATPDGRFVASALTASDYHLRAWAAHVTEVPTVSEITGRERQSKDSATWSAEVERVSVGAADLQLVLGPGLVVRGVVRGDDGAPLDSFRVTAQRLSFPGDSWDGRGKLTDRFRNADGTFELTGFQPGTWAIEASAKDRIDSDPVQVQLPGAGPIELRLAREAAVRGVVLATDGHPAARARVRVVQPARELGSIQLFGQELERQTDREGAFEIDGLRAGRAILTAQSPGGTPGESLEVELAAGATLGDVVLRLLPGCSLEGQVVDRSGRPEAGLTVHVHVSGSGHDAECTTDAQGRFRARNLPAGSAMLYAENGEGVTLGARVELQAGETARVQLAPPPDTPVRLHGRVVAAGAALAHVHVSAMREGAGWMDQGSRVSATRSTDEQGAYELVLPGGGLWLVSVSGGAGGIEDWAIPIDVPEAIELERDLVLSVGRISGRVRGADGAAVAGVQVRSHPYGLEGGTRGWSSVQTDPQGRYELVLPVGRHAIVAGGDPGYFSGGPRDWSTARIDGLRIDEGEHRANVDFELQPGGTLTGIVRGPAGAPMPLAVVLIGGDADMHQAGITDLHGAFHIEGVAPGTHWLRAIAEASATPQARSVEVRAGAATEVELALSPAVLVRVRVLDAAGAALGGEIEAFDADGRPVPVHPTGGPGSAQLGPLTPAPTA